MKFAGILFAFFFVILLGSNLKAEIYSWTDENGVKHYSNVPPPDVENVEIKFEEYAHDSAADKSRAAADQEQMEALIKEIDQENRRLEAEKKQRAQEAEKNKPPSKEEIIEAEKQKLTEKIVELEAAPLERFGSQRNKILTIGFYKYRLEALLQDPDKYFREPVKFEGNVKYSDQY
jgi:hypothetical protein